MATNKKLQLGISLPNIHQSQNVVIDPSQEIHIDGKRYYPCNELNEKNQKINYF